MGIIKKNLTKKQRMLLVNVLRLLIITGFLAFWEFASGRLIEAFIISSPSRIYKAFFTFLLSGDLFKHTWVTLKEIIIGYTCGCSLGIVVAFGLGRSKTLADVFEPFLLALYAIPRIALAPLLIIWLGIGIWSKVGIVVLMTFFLTFFNVYEGMKHMDKNYIDLAKLMGASNTTISYRVILPAISPFIVLGLKTSIPQAIIAAIVGEFIVSMAGLGYIIRRSAELFDTPALFVSIGVLLLIVLLANTLLNVCENLVIKWKVDTHST